MPEPPRSAHLARAFALVVLAASTAFADGGAQLERFEPSAAGNWFFGVEHPWYTETRRLAAGLTLDYGHNALLAGKYSADGTFAQKVAIVEHQLVGHVDV